MEAVLPILPDLGAVSENIKKWAATQASFTRFLQAKLPEAKALARWALDLLRANQFGDAIIVLRSALALAPNDPTLWTNYGIALSQTNSPGEAAACFEHSLSLSRHQPETWLMLGLAKKKLGDPGAAEAAYRMAIAQDPNASVAWQLIAVIKEEQKDFASAVECLDACVKAGDATAAILANLGKLNHQLGRIAASSEAYGKATAMEPATAHYRQMARKTTFMRNALDGQSIADAIAHYQESFAPAENCSEKDLTDLLHSSFSILSGFGHTEAAARVGKKHQELWPNDHSLAYLLSAVAGDQSIERSPSEYVVEHFDAFAEGFEAQLVGALGYDIPEKICTTVGKVVTPGHLHQTLDAGCGTGLCGPHLRQISRTLTGVDLSPKMLEQAAKKGVYDTLVCQELTTYLLNAPVQFDLIVAADLMIYFGDLVPLFEALATALKPAGHLAFSTELWTGEGHRLQPSGRFAHAPDYVRSVAAQEFIEVFSAATTIRLEATSRLSGTLFIFRRDS